MGRGLSARAFDAAAVSGPVADAAVALLGAVLVSEAEPGRVVLRITEVEAYGGVDDPASHAWRGTTARNAVMAGPPGRAYVYFSYGMHWCLNIVAHPPGEAGAVLVRAGEVVDGQAAAAGRRPGVASRDWARGPGRLTRALGVTGAAGGLDLLDAGSPLRLEPAAAGAPRPVRSGPRVGVSRAADVAWRFWLADEPTVSRYTRSPRATAPGTGARPAGPLPDSAP